MQALKLCMNSSEQVLQRQESRVQTSNPLCSLRAESDPLGHNVVTTMYYYMLPPTRNFPTLPLHDPVPASSSCNDPLTYPFSCLLAYQISQLRFRQLSCILFPAATFLPEALLPQIVL